MNSDRLKSIDTLVGDIYGLFKTPQKVKKESAEKLGQEIAKSITEMLEGGEQEPSLRFSNLGTPCKRKLWYSIRAPQLSEPLPPYVKIKFLFGHILETLLLFLSEQAGHTVTGRQDELSIGTVKGHRDAVIDGRTIDVKSATTFSFKKFRENRLTDDDPFGYIDQINAYRAADKDNVDDKVSFLAIDKQLGHIVLDTYPANEVNYEEKIDRLKAIVDADEPPERGFSDEEMGAKGNRKLCMTCSYCPFKEVCWPGLRTFVYSNGPVYLTKVEETPKVLEINGTEKF